MRLQKEQQKNSIKTWENAVEAVEPNLAPQNMFNWVFAGLPGGIDLLIKENR